MSRYFTQLDPQIPLETPKGSAMAVGVIDYSQEHDILWVCFMQDTGQCWTWHNSEVRAERNISIKRKSPEVLHTKERQAQDIKA